MEGEGTDLTTLPLNTPHKPHYTFSPVFSLHKLHTFDSLSYFSYTNTTNFLHSPAILGLLTKIKNREYNNLLEKTIVLDIQGRNQVIKPHMLTFNIVWIMLMYDQSFLCVAYYLIYLSFTPIITNFIYFDQLILCMTV